MLLSSSLISSELCFDGISTRDQLEMFTKILNFETTNAQCGGGVGREDHDIQLDFFYREKNILILYIAAEREIRFTSLRS